MTGQGVTPGGLVRSATESVQYQYRSHNLSVRPSGQPERSVFHCEPNMLAAGVRGEDMINHRMMMIRVPFRYVQAQQLK